MTILAGTLTPGGIGNVDGVGSAAALRNAHGIATDAADNLYVSQAGDAALRRIMPDGTVSSLSISLPAMSSFPNDVAVDPTGNLYLSTCPTLVGFSQPPPGGVVLKVDARSAAAVVLAGSPTEPGYQDGTGAQARFGSCLGGLALDAAGNVFVADTGNSVVRRITPDGTVSTVVGEAGVRGITLGPLPASLSAPTDVGVDGAGNLTIGSTEAILKARFSR